VSYPPPEPPAGPPTEYGPPPGYSPQSEYAAPPTAPQPAYAAPPNPYAPPQYSATPAPVTNTSAVIAFVLSLLGLVFTPIVDIAAVILAHHALSTTRRTGQAGAGLAKAALVIGYSLIVAGAALTAFLASMIAASVAV